jgi:hypothetical protein
MDVARGATEAPRQAVGGVRDAAQSILDFGDWIETQAPLGGVQVFNEAGEFDPRILSGKSFAKERKKGRKLELPDVSEAKSTTGNVIRHVTQFMVPYGR